MCGEPAADVAEAESDVARIDGQAAADARAARDANTLVEILRRAAVSYSDKVAVQVCREGEWTRLSFCELADRASEWGRVLAAAGLSARTRALLVAESGPEWAAACFAALSQGAVVVPLDPQLSAEDILTLARRTDSRVWLLSPAAAERVADVIPRVDPPHVFEIEDFLAPPGASGIATQAGEAASAIHVEPADIASMPFTSGTTLAPKGVLLTHDNLLSNVRAVLESVRLDSSDEFLAVLPLHHVLAFTTTLILPLSIGATVTYLDRLTPRALLEAMQATGTTVLIAVPRLLALLVRGIRSSVEAAPRWRRALFSAMLAAAQVHRGLGGIAPPLAPALRRLRAVLFRPIHRRFGGRMRLLVSGGAALPPEIFQALDLLGFCVCEGYGLTETSPVLTLNRPRAPRPGSVGRPLPGVEVRIDDPGPDGVGEVLARGPGVFSGYFEDPEATRRAFSGGWFRTGDHGRLDADGHLVLSGRADDLIVTGGGKNVYPEEVEWLYRELPRVKELCVVGAPDPGSAGDAVHAVIVLDDPDGGPPPEARRREVEAALTRIGRQLPPHQRIRGVHFREGELPRTSTLKVKRREVRERLLESLATRRRGGG